MFATLIDINSLGFASQAGGKPLFAGDLETTAVFNTLRSLRIIREEFPGPMFALWDGRSWRYNHYPDYKGKRHSDDKMKDLRDRWVKQRPLLAKVMHHLGIGQVRAANYEADDLAFYLSRKMLASPAKWHVALVSSDKDWLQLLDDRVMFFDYRQEQRITMSNFDVMYPAVPKPSLIADLKAMMGDVSDNIKGCGGVGEKTAQEILACGRTVEEQFAEFDRTPAPAKLDRIGKFFADHAKREAFRFNMGLVQLGNPITPEPEDYKMTPGVFNLNAFNTECRQMAMFSISHDVDNWVRPFQSTNTVR